MAVWKMDWGRGGKEQDPRQRNYRRQLQNLSMPDPVSSISQWEESKGGDYFGFQEASTTCSAWTLFGS